jgi:dienelactone hydrolase
MNSSIATVKAALILTVTGWGGPTFGAQTNHQLSSIGVLSNGTARLELSGSPSSTFGNYFDLYPIEASTDLQQWTPLVTLTRTNSSLAPLRFVDSQAVNFPARFYRTPSNELLAATPPPTGPHAVGSIVRQLTDPARADRPPLRVQIWYPAEPVAGGLPMPYVDTRIAADWATINGGDSNIQRAYQVLRGHATSNAPVASAETRYPVVLYSHGQGSIPIDNTPNAENLASHGFVVVAMSHAWGYITALEDGRVVYGFQPILFFEDLAERVRDMQFIMDELGRWNAGEVLFAGRLDVEHLGVFGWSFGGLVATELCAHDARCKAGISMDGALSTFRLTFRQPFLILAGGDSDTLLNPHRLRNRTLFDRQTRPDVYYARIAASTHAVFGDPPWIFTPTDTVRLRHAIVARDYVQAFFKKHLRGEDNHLLDTRSPAYPEVDVFLRSGLFILAQPQSLNVRRGFNATLAVAAAGSLPIRYQWQLDGTNLPGATATNYTIANAQSNHVGAYTVLLADGVSTLTSAPANVDVGDPPVVVQGLTNQTATAGASATFLVTVTGTPPFGFEWRKGSSIVASNTVSEATAVYTVLGVQTSDAGTWRVIVRNKFNLTTSANSSATLTVQ